MTVKKGELCSRISTVLNTRLRDCSVQAEGGERREGRKVGKIEGGGEAIQRSASWLDQ